MIIDISFPYAFGPPDRMKVQGGVVRIAQEKGHLFVHFIPNFRRESLIVFLEGAEERKFWETHDPSDYLDWSKAERVLFPNLKLSTQSISIRLPVSLLEQIKIEANKRDVPYQSLIKVWLAEKVHS